MNNDRPPINCAYFSMEFMLESDIPTYAGGLGVLAGDLMRSCADMGEPVVGMSLVYNDSTYKQVINPSGTQNYEQLVWHKNDQLTKLSNRVEVTIQGQKVIVGVWRYDIVGIDGYVVPVFLLDTDFIDNSEYARSLTQNLYEGGVRLDQEVLLGMAGFYKSLDIEFWIVFSKFFTKFVYNVTPFTHPAIIVSISRMSRFGATK